MALTRAQLLSGNSSQGTVLAGQVQGVTAGAGISIAANGTITIDSQSVVGVMKLGQTPAAAAAAYNSYDWPTATGTAGQQLTIAAVGGVTTLAWGDPDQIPWTAKGQLVVGTGVGTQTLLNVGTNGQILIADSSQASGLGYTGDYVATTGATSSALIPAGAIGARPVSPVDGAFRFNNTSSTMEFWNGSSWQIVTASATGLFVDKTSATGSAVIPGGTALQRDASPAAGYFRFNTGSATMEFWDGGAWVTVASANPLTSTFVSQSVASLPAGATGNALIPAGSTAQRQTAPALTIGATRFNTTTGKLEVWGGVAWETVASSTSGTYVAQTAPTLPATATPSAVIPAGSTADRQTSPAPAQGYTRFNTTNTNLEVWDGAAWTAVGAPPTAGLGINITGVIVKVSIPTVSTPPAAGALAAQAIDGSLYWDSTLGALFIRYNDGTTTQWVQAAASASGGGTAVSAASLAEAAAGTINTKFSSPQTSVPKDASGMTGAALIPGGNDAARPGTPVTGMLRYNSQSGTPVSVEYYDGAAWSGVGGGGSGGVQAVVKFDGFTGTIYGSSNVSSVTRVSTGLYTVNFITAMSSTDYTMCMVGGGANAIVTYTLNAATPPTTSGFTFETRGIQPSTYYDVNPLYATVFE